MTKVYLLAGKLPFYKDLLRYPPNGIKYTNKADYSKDIVSYYSSSKHSMQRKLTSFLIEKFNVPRMFYVPSKECDIIHSNRGILILNKKPWVMDIDTVGYFFGNVLNHTNLGFDYHILKSFVGRFLVSRYCKKIICWSDAAKNSVTNVFESKVIQSKLDVLYPAIPALKLRKRTHENKIKLLYVSSSFATKGGEELLKAFEILLGKYDNIELIFKCDVPEDIKTKYSFKETKYFPYRTQLLSRDDLIKNFYMKSDVFIYPTLAELFGLSLLDAMVAGIPIVTTNLFSIPEIVKNGKNGFLLDNPSRLYKGKHLTYGIRDKNSTSLFINQMVEKLSLLIEDSSLRKRMGRYNRKLVEKGKFSIIERNKRLKAIYEDSLKQ